MWPCFSCCKGSSESIFEQLKKKKKVLQYKRSHGRSKDSFNEQNSVKEKRKIKLIKSSSNENKPVLQLNVFEIWALFLLSELNCVRKRQRSVFDRIFVTKYLRICSKKTYTPMQPENHLFCSPISSPQMLKNSYPYCLVELCKKIPVLKTLEDFQNLEKKWIEIYNVSVDPDAEQGVQMVENKAMHPFVRYIERNFQILSEEAVNKLLAWWKTQTLSIEVPILQAAITTVLNMPKEVSPLQKLQLIEVVQTIWDSSECQPVPHVDFWKPLYIRYILAHEHTVQLLNRIVKKPPATTLKLLKHLKIPKKPIMINDDLHGVFAFKNNLFSGFFILRSPTAYSRSTDLKAEHHENVRLQNSSSAVPSSDSAVWMPVVHPYFASRKRVMQYVVQGRFRKSIPINQVLVGQSFRRPFLSIPPPWTIKILITILTSIFPGVVVNFTPDESSYIFLPLIMAAQTIHICDCEREASPDMRSCDIWEDTTILNAPYNPLSRDERKSYFNNVENSSKFNFEPKYIYTFEFYQHLFDVIDYVVHTPIINLNLSQHINRQPVELCAFIEHEYAHLFSDNQKKNADDIKREFLWRLQLCHNSIL